MSYTMYDIFNVSLTFTAFLKASVGTFMVPSLSKAWKKSMTVSFRSSRNFCVGEIMLHIWETKLIAQ